MGLRDGAEHGWRIESVEVNADYIAVVAVLAAKSGARRRERAV